MLKNFSVFNLSSATSQPLNPQKKEKSEEKFVENNKNQRKAAKSCFCRLRKESFDVPRLASVF